METVYGSSASEASLVPSAEADKPLKSLLKVGVIVLIIATSLVLIIAIVTLLVVVSSNKNPAATKRQSTPYEETIQTIKSYGNFEADPCTNFSEFACGKFLEVAPRLHYKPSWTSTDWAFYSVQRKLHTLLMSNDQEASSAVTKVKEYFKSCVEPASSDFGSLREVIRKLGGWPLMDSNWDEEAWSLQTSLQVAMQYQCFPLLRIQMDSDYDPPVPIIRGPALTLSNPDEPLAPRAFKQAVYSTLQKLLGVDERGEEEMSEEVENQIAEMWAFEKDLREIIKNPGPYYGDQKMVSEIEPVFEPWLDLNSLMKEYFNSTILPTDKVKFLHPYYLNNLTTFISKYSTSSNSRVLANYVVWTVLRSITTSIKTQFESAAKILERLINDETGQTDTGVAVPRWDTCVIEVLYRFKFATAHLYIKRHLQPSHKKEVEDMCKRIINLAKNNRPGFYDEETMNNTIAKLLETECVIAYPSFVMNITSLDQYYEQYQGGSNYLHNYIQYRRFHTYLTSTQYGRRSDPQHWPTPPLYPNAQYDIDLNKLVVFAGLFHSPAYYPLSSPEVSLGTFGFTLAHEISHAFLYPDFQLASGGELKDAWTSATKMAFNVVEDCYIEHFDKLKMFNRSIDGARTSNENMADSAGLSLAFQALLERYGGGEEGWEKLREPVDQTGGKLDRGKLFFVVHAQTSCSFYDEKTSGRKFHSPHIFENIRVQGTLQNSREFSRVFNCPPNSTFNPTPKCHIYAP